MAPLFPVITTIGAGGITTASTFSLGTAAALAGTGIAAAGAIQAGRQAEATAKSQENLELFNAQIEEQNKKAIKAATKFKSKRQAEETARRKSTLRTRIAAAEGTGSPVAIDLAAELAAEQELEGLLIGFEGEVAATQAERQAELDIASGKIARKRGKALKTASRIKAGTTLLQGFA